VTQVFRIDYNEEASSVIFNRIGKILLSRYIHLRHPASIAVCYHQRQLRLFLLDDKNQAAVNDILRIDPDSGHVEMSWPVGYTHGTRKKLLVSANQQILMVTNSSFAQYTTNGELVRDVDLSSSINYERHLYDVILMPHSKYDQPGHSLPHSDHIVLN